MSPDRIVIGCDSETSRAVMQDLYAPFSRNHDKLQFMGLRDAEMTKYAANAMLATKISFMNEIALLCDQYGVDVENVRKGIGSDPRIGYSFIYPGSGYGGSCFPKDVRALIAMAESVGVDPRIFKSVEDRNRSQKTVLMASIEQYFGSDLTGKTFALWGLAFKPETDDVREAPALDMIHAIVDKGGVINAYDPQAMSTASAELTDAQRSSVNFMQDPYAAITGADALLIMTEWKMFRQPDFNLLSKLKEKIIFDGRNMYDPEHVSMHGLTYVGIGRSSGPVPTQ
jgi:UDPglucose 6-dehydrogenase